MTGYPLSETASLHDTELPKEVIGSPYRPLEKILGISGDFLASTTIGALGFGMDLPARWDGRNPLTISPGSCFAGWFWLHRRWKVQPDGISNPYDD